MAAAAGTLAALRNRSRNRDQSPGTYDEDRAALGWGDLEEPAERTVPTPDGAQLAVWDIGDPTLPVVVLPHCWGCSHAIWIPVARRLLDTGHRVVLYDQRGHGASTRA